MDEKIEKHIRKKVFENKIESFDRFVERKSISKDCWSLLLLFGKYRKLTIKENEIKEDIGVDVNMKNYKEELNRLVNLGLISKTPLEEEGCVYKISQLGEDEIKFLFN